MANPRGSLSDPRYSWILNTTYGPHGWSSPVTHKSAGTGKTSVYSGLLSRRRYARVIRESVPVPVLEDNINELKALARRANLSDRQKKLFERHVIGPLMDPLAPKPPYEDSAIEFGISVRRVKKDIYAAKMKIMAEHERQEKEQSMNAVANFATMRRQTGGVSFQSDGLYRDAYEIRPSVTYSTSINSAATAVSSSNTTYKDSNNV